MNSSLTQPEGIQQTATYPSYVWAETGHIPSDFSEMQKLYALLVSPSGILGESLEDQEDQEDREHALATLEEIRRTGERTIPWGRVKADLGL